MRAKTKLTLSVLLILVSLYLVLLIPGPSLNVPEPGLREPFLWNSDDYFSQLENRFLQARELSSEELTSRINSGFVDFDKDLAKLQNSGLAPDDNLFDRIESDMFNAATLVAADPNRVVDLIDRYTVMRNGVKRQSRAWDMNSPAARHRVYRLLYGGRTALEEIMMQSPPGSYPSLIMGYDEPSATPSAEILGVKIHSGDILVSRGGAPTSALIARGNDYPGNFSHVAQVYVDPDSLVPRVIESHIEIGVAIATIEQYLKDKKLRVMILRPRAELPRIEADPMLPHKAAESVYRRAQAGHIAYDFAMDYNDPSKLFCSEVASSAYKTRGFILWTGLSNISSIGVRSWLAAFGVRNFQTQEPSDLEYDPQLSVVAEWRDPETLYKDRLDNAVIDVMLEEADKGKKLEYDWYMLPIGRIMKGYSYILNLFGKAGPIPEGMSPEAALRNKRFSSEHDEIKARTVALASEFENEKRYKPPYWELVKLARQAQTR